MELTYQEKKDRILSKIFITSEEAEKLKNKREVELLEDIIYFKKDNKILTECIQRIIERLGLICREKDPFGKSKELREVFETFSKDVENVIPLHLSKQKSKIEQQINSYKTKVRRMEEEVIDMGRKIEGDVSSG